MYFFVWSFSFSYQSKINIVMSFSYFSNHRNYIYLEKKWPQKKYLSRCLLHTKLFSHPFSIYIQSLFAFTSLLFSLLKCITITFISISPIMLQSLQEFLSYLHKHWLSEADHLEHGNRLYIVLVIFVSLESKKDR